MKIAFVCIGERPHAEYTVESFRKVCPKAEIIQITDYDSDVIRGVDTVVRMDNKYLMITRMEGYKNIVIDDYLIAIDDDCLITDSFADELDGDYDVAIVKRSQLGREGGRLRHITTNFPYTTGFIIVRNNNFFTDCYNELMTMSEKKWEWWGDMLCVRRVIDSGRYNVKLLSEEKYYKKPDKKEHLNKETKLWHYSGKRKNWMNDKWKEFAQI